MARLQGKYRPCCVVASQFGEIISVKGGQIADQIRREDVLPRDRLHVVVEPPALILAFRLLIGKVRHVKARSAEAETRPHQISRRRRVIEFEETLKRFAFVVKILYGRRIKITL